MGKLEVVNLRSDKRWDVNKENCVYIGRPSKLSNPYSSKKSNVEGIIHVTSSEQSLILFQQHFKTNYNELEDEIDEIISLMKIYDEVFIGCFCKPNNCHGDIIRNHIIMKIHKNKIQLRL